MNQKFTIVTEGMCMMRRDLGLTCSETMALIALTHHMPDEDREVGTNGDYVMCSREVAEYGGLSSPAAARRAISGLRRKGVLEVSRHVLKPTTQLTVYRLTERAYEMCFGDKDEDTEPKQDDPCSTDDTGGVSHMIQGVVSQVIHTPISNPLSTPVSQKENAFSRKSGDWSGRRRLVPKYPYPGSPDEVLDYLISVRDLRGYDLADLFADDYEMAERFFMVNEESGWMVEGKDGLLEPIIDWHFMLFAYLLTTANNIDPDMGWSMPPEFVPGQTAMAL